MEFKTRDIENLPDIVRVNEDIFAGMYEWPPYLLEKYLEKLKDREFAIFTAEENGELAGDCISFEREGAWYLWILGVRKEYRHQGIAGTLLDLNEQYARGHGHTAVAAKVYNVSPEMLRLLIKRGYQIVGVEKHENNKYNAIFFELPM